MLICSDISLICIFCFLIHLQVMRVEVASRECSQSRWQ